jgi:hypothetical protein
LYPIAQHRLSELERPQSRAGTFLPPIVTTARGDPDGRHARIGAGAGFVLSLCVVLPVESALGFFDAHPLLKLTNAAPVDVTGTFLPEGVPQGLLG